MDVTEASEHWQCDSNRYGDPVISIVDIAVVFTLQFILMTRDYPNPNPYLSIFEPFPAVSIRNVKRAEWVVSVNKNAFQ